MKSYSFKCRKDTEKIDPRVSNTSNGRKRYYQNVQCVVVKNQDLLKIKNQGAKGLLSNLGVRTPLNKVPIFTNKVPSFY